MDDFTIANFGFGSSSSELIGTLGQPASTYTEYWEIGDVTATIYQYLGAKFEFVNNELVGFKISDPQIFIHTDLTTFTVGDLITSLQNYYPDSYSLRENGFMAINFGTGDHEYLLIKYASDKKIVGIEHRIY